MALARHPGRPRAITSSARRAPSGTQRAVRRGFTLVELVVATGLIGMLAAGATWYWVNSFTLMRDGAAVQAAQSSAHNALDRLAREFRELKFNTTTASYCVNTMAAASVVFYRTQGSYIATCSTTATPTSANADFAITVARASGASTVTLAYAGALASPAVTSTLVSDVTGFGLRYLAQDATTTTTDLTLLRYVELTLTVQPAGTAATTARTLVALRH